jgi:hypothetical protein
MTEAINERRPGDVGALWVIAHHSRDELFQHGAPGVGLVSGDARTEHHLV